MDQRKRDQDRVEQGELARDDYLALVRDALRSNLAEGDFRVHTDRCSWFILTT